MKPILVSAILLASALDAQVASIELRSPQTFVLAGRSMALSASPRNAAGALLKGVALAWKSSDPARASVDSAGIVRGVAPGVISVTATDPDSGAAASRSLYVYPGRIAITPERLTVEAGSSGRFSAQVLDADGAPIQGIAVTWSSGLPGVASVNGGLVTGVAEGWTTVTAAIDMGLGYVSFTATAPVQVMRRPDFRLNRLIASDTTAAATVLAPTAVAAAGEYVAGIAAMSNGGQAILLSRSGQRPRVVSSAGIMLDALGKIPSRWLGLSVNSKGDLLALFDTPHEWCEQNLVKFAAPDYSPSAALTATNCSLSLEPNSLADNGSFVYRSANTLFLRAADGKDTRIASAGDQPPGSEKITNVNNWSYSRFGTVLIETPISNGRTQYLAWDGASLRPLFATGDLAAGRGISWANMPVEVNRGEFIAHIGGSNWASISKLTASGWTILAVNGEHDLSWIHNGYDGFGGTFYFWADSQGKTSLFRYKDGAFEKLATVPSWRETGDLFLGSNDNVIGLGVLGGGPVHAARYAGGAESVLFGVGSAVEGPAGAGIYPKSVRPSGWIRTAGDSLLKPGTASGAILKPGDALPGGDAVWSVVGCAGNPSGDLAVMLRTSMYRSALYAWRGGKLQALAQTDDKLGGTNITFQWLGGGDEQVAINSQGQVAAMVGTSSGNFVYLFTDSAASAKRILQLGAPLPGGGAAQWVMLAIDEAGRVGIWASLDNGGWAIFLWDNGNLQRVLEQGQPDSLGRKLGDIRAILAAATKFYVQAYLPDAGNAVLQVDTAGTSTVLNNGYTPSFGTQVSSLYGPSLAANRRFDLLFPAITPSGAGLFVKRADGGDGLVALEAQPDPQGEWLLSIYGGAVMDTGDVYFTALTWADGRQHISVYGATAGK